MAQLNKADVLHLQVQYPQSVFMKRIRAKVVLTAVQMVQYRMSENQRQKIREDLIRQIALEITDQMIKVEGSTIDPSNNTFMISASVEIVINP